MKNRSAMLFMGLSALLLVALVAREFSRSGGGLPDSRLPCEEPNFSITELKVSSCPGDSFPSKVFEFRDLNTLIIQKGNFTDIPDRLSEFGKLRKIIIRNTPLKKIPEAILNGPFFLNTVVFENCPIEVIDPRATRFSRLSIINGQVKEIPITFFDTLFHNELLNLTGNQIEHLPPGKAFFENPKELNLSYNPLKEFPWDPNSIFPPREINLLETEVRSLPKDPKWDWEGLESAKLYSVPKDSVPEAWRNRNPRIRLNQ